MLTKDAGTTADRPDLLADESPVRRSGSSSHSAQGEASDADPRLQLVERIANSEPFQKSSRLPPLLRYLAAHSLQHDRAALTEHAIGRSVFDKPKDFNPADDSSVRVYMRQLRLRLHEFYQSTGRDEALVVEVPKGGYALAFHSVEPAEHLPHTTALAPLPSHAPSAGKSGKERLKPALPWILFAVACVLALAGWYRALRTMPAAPIPWPLSAVVHANRQTTVVLADATYSARMLWTRDFTLEDYIRHDWMRELARNDTSKDAPLMHYLESAQITSMADAHAAAMLVGLAGPSWRNLDFRSAKELTPSMLSQSDLIFIGAKTSNPWVELYESWLNFPLVQLSDGSRYVANRSPRPGERKEYEVVEATGSSGEDYATISLLPNAGAQGSVLLVQGVRLEGTEAAIRFLGEPERRSELQQRLKEANGGKLPNYFEALLHAHSVAGSAVSIDCIAVRALPG